VGIGSTGYNVLLVLHLLSVVAAFGPLLVVPMIRRQAPEAALRATQYLVLPGVVLAWVFGMGLVGMSDDAWELTDPWILASLLVWLFMLAAAAVVWQSFRKADMARLAAPMTGVIHLLVIVQLYLMVFKPS
jgi:predicted transporter